MAQADGNLTGRPAEWLEDSDYREVTTKSHAEGILLLAGHFAFYFVTLLGALAPVHPLINLPFAALNGLAIGLIFIIGHDCVHKAFVPSKIGNQILARLAFTPCAHSVSQWEVVHNKNHHGKTNFRKVDYVWAPMDLEEYRSVSPVRRWLEHIYRGPLGPLFYYYIEFWSSKLLAPVTAEMRAHWRRHLPDSIYVISTLLATIAGILVLGKAIAPERSLWMIFLIGWFIPYTVWNYLAAISIYLQHTHPNVRWFDDPKEWSFYNGAVAGSTHVEIPFTWVGLYVDVMGHTAHHALPSIPIYKLKDAQKKLLDTYGNRITKYKFTLAEYGRILKACKLYNYKEHYWTDFHGMRTGPFLAGDRSAGTSENPFRAQIRDDAPETEKATA